MQFNTVTFFSHCELKNSQIFVLKEFLASMSLSHTIQHFKFQFHAFFRLSILILPHFAILPLFEVGKMANGKMANWQNGKMFANTTAIRKQL
jgi:hypothetical protein